MAEQITDFSEISTTDAEKIGSDAEKIEVSTEKIPDVF